MEGITILNTIIMPNVILGTFTIAGLIAILIGFFVYLKDDEVFGSIIMVVGVIVSVICGIFFLTSEKKEQYEVTIDENVNFNEFMEHYKIIKQRGQIYVIEERQTDSTI